MLPSRAGFAPRHRGSDAAKRIVERVVTAITTARTSVSDDRLSTHEPPRRRAVEARLVIVQGPTALSPLSICRPLYTLSAPTPLLPTPCSLLPTPYNLLLGAIPLHPAGRRADTYLEAPPSGSAPAGPEGGATPRRPYCIRGSFHD